MNIISMTDAAGQELHVGDLVIRALFSDMTFHRIVRINKKSIALSNGLRVHTMNSGRTWTSRAYAQRIQDVDLPDFNNNQAIRIWINSTNSTTRTLYKITE